MKPLLYLTTVCMLLCAPLGLAQNAAGESCEAADRKATQNAAQIPSYQSGYKVVGQGKAYFYSAPLENCKQKAVFLVSNDEVIAYLDYEAFTSVMYIHPVSGKTTEGWIKTERLVSTGTGTGPNPTAENR